MRDWFKARNIWGAAITALSDEEAGKLAKAIWSFTMNGEIVEIDRAGKGILAMILMTLSQDAERDGEISEKRAIAGKSGAMATNSGKIRQLPTNANTCQQMPSSADNKNKNKNKEQEQESESESELSDEAAAAIVTEQNRVLDAAEDAGFQRTNSVRAKLIDLYALHGKDKMLMAIGSCVQHGVANLAYLEAVLSGSPKKQKNKPQNPAQDYEQRDWSGDQKRAIDDMMSWNPEVDEA